MGWQGPLHIEIDNANNNDYHLSVSLDQSMELFQTLMNLRQLCLCAAVLVLPAVSFAADTDVILVIKDHHFVPEEIKVPANKKIRLMVDNQDATPEEFESKSLHREKVIPGKTKLPVSIGPLKPGKYTFVGEFHEATASGVVIAE